jgi:hypothetical protein
MMLGELTLGTLSATLADEESHRLPLASAALALTAGGFLMAVMKNDDAATPAERAARDDARALLEQCHTRLASLETRREVLSTCVEVMRASAIGMQAASLITPAGARTTPAEMFAALQLLMGAIMNAWLGASAVLDSQPDADHSALIAEARTIVETAGRTTLELHRTTGVSAATQRATTRLGIRPHGVPPAG